MNIEAFYLPENDEIGLILYDKINGAELDTLWNNYKLENILIFEILSEEDKWIKVKTTYSYKESIGWVEPLQLNVRIGTLEEPMILRTEPNHTSNKVIEFTGQYFVTIIQLFGDWTKVKLVTHEKEVVEGWVYKSTCGNPFTYCN